MAPKIFVFFATKAPLATVLVKFKLGLWRLYQWDLRTDSFQNGQFYERKIIPSVCALSNNGTFFNYGVLTGDSKSMKMHRSISPYFTPVEVRNNLGELLHDNLDIRMVKKVIWKPCKFTNEKPTVPAMGAPTLKVDLKKSSTTVVPQVSHRHPITQALYEIKGTALWHDTVKIKDFGEAKESDIKEGIVAAFYDSALADVDEESEEELKVDSEDDSDGDKDSLDGFITSDSEIG